MANSAPSGSDQEPAGRLSGAYCRATDKFLRDAGLDPDDVDAVMNLLAPYKEVEAEDGGPGYRASVQWPGSQDALRRRQIAQDALLPVHLRRWPTPAMTSRQQAAYEARFPGAAEIKVL
jgi:hypothetical protein